MPVQPTRILLVEDNDLDAVSVRRFLAQAGRDEFVVIRATTLKEALELLSGDEFDVVLLDLNLPDSVGIDTFKALDSQDSRRPIVILTGEEDEALGVTAVRLGAQDYLGKGFLGPQSLARAIRYARERHQLYRELDSRERMLRQLLEANADGILIVSANGLIRYINPAGAGLLGAPANGLIDRPFGHVLQEGPPREMKLRRHDGGTIDVEISVVRTEWKNEPALLATMRDMTMRKEAEAKWLANERRNQQARKLESLGVLSGGISHGLNNLLTAILANASMLKAEADPESPAYQMLQQVEAAATEAGDACLALLNYTGGVRPVEIVRTQVNDMIENHRRMLEFSLADHVQLVFEPGRDIPEIDGDPALLSQALLNLVSNASEARGDESPTVWIRTAVAELSAEDGISARWPQEVTPGRYVCLEVADNGCGMPEETVEKIYDPFFSTRFAGRGMGMAVVMGIIRAHNGMIRIDSAVGKGTRVRVYLPSVPTARSTVLLSPEDEAGGKGPHQGAGLGAGRTMLVVDDEEMVRRASAKALEKLGFKTSEAGTGRAALEWFEAHGDQCSAVLLDYLMPEMKGDEALRRLLDRRPDLPVVLTSGHTRDEDLSNLLQRDNVVFLPKPFSIDDLEKVLAELLR